jgi:hypothetical protein
VSRATDSLSKKIILPVTVGVMVGMVIGWHQTRSAEPSRSEVQAQIAEAASAPSEHAQPGFDLWTLVDGASRQADELKASEPDACQPGFLRDPHLSEVDINRLSALHAQVVIEQHAARLRMAPDALGRLTGAMLADDYATLIQVGQTTSDPLVYGLALRACPSQRVPGCTALTPQRWAELDESNASAWWMVAASAQNQADALRALTSASTATHALPLRNQWLKRAAQTDEATREAMFPVLMKTIHLDSLELSPSTAGFTKACGSTPSTDPERSAACLGFALDAVRLEPSAIGKLIATRLAERWGAKAHQLPHTVAELKTKVEAIGNWRSSMVTGAEGRQFCEGIRQMVEFDADSADDGDLAAFERLQARRKTASAR